MHHCGSLNDHRAPNIINQKCELYQEEEHVIVVGAVLKVHAESSIHVAQVMVVIQLSKGLI